MAPVTADNLYEWIFAYDATMQLNWDWYKLSTPDFLLFPWGGDFLFWNGVFAALCSICIILFFVDFIYFIYLSFVV
jgi:hypothetical protein